MVVITNLTAAVFRINVLMAKYNVREEFHKRVLVAYGQVVQNVMQTGFAVAETVFRVVRTSTFGEIHAKITVRRIADRMEVRVPRTMQPQRVQLAHVFIRAKPIIAMFPVHV